MTVNDIMALADVYAHGYDANPNRDEFNDERAALLAAVEAMAQELEAAKAQAKLDNKSITFVTAEAERIASERDALQAKLETLEKQEPVAYRAWFDADNGARWLFSLWPDEERLEVDWKPLYLAAGAAHKEQT